MPVEEIAGDSKLFGVLVLDAVDAAFAEFVDPGVGIGEQDGGVRGDDELAAMMNEAVKESDDRELPLRREGGFGFVEEIQPSALQAFFQQSEK